MNKNQLKKVLDSITNRIDKIISEVSLNDEEFETTLSENNYSVICKVTIENAASYEWKPRVNGLLANTNPYTIYAAEKGKSFSLNIEASPNVRLMVIQMNGVDIKDNTDLCDYTIITSEIYNKPDIINITIPNVTGDIYVLIYSEIPPS